MSQRPNALDVLIESNVPVPMRDGVLLHADVYRPSRPGRYPVLLQRTPYDKASPAVTGIDYLRAASAGYAVVVQDMRGRFASQGEFYPFLNEASDGYDTVEWTAVQPWSNGHVGMVGGSYLGAAQWLAAMASPPHLKALFPAITPSDYQEGWVFQGGAFQLGFCLSWTLGPLVLENLPSLTATHSQLGQRRDELAHALDHLDEAFRHLPLLDVPYFQNGAAPYYYAWLRHADDAAYWKRWSVYAHHQRLRVPAYHVGGWYDPFLAGTLQNFTGMQQAGAFPQKLLIGPWAHTSPLASMVGELDFGTASAAGIDLDGIQLHWFDHWLKGESDSILDEPPVRLFVMGANRWREEQEWPLARARDQYHYLHSRGHANTAAGDGSLDLSTPGDEPPDVFLYDPRDPVPTRGGALCCNAIFLPGGAYDQRPVEARQDVLVYTSDPLEQDLEVTGPVQLQLWAATTARDTDFTAKLVDVYPDGRAYNLADGVLRTRYRESREGAALVQPGEAYAFLIDLGATSNVFKAGHRVCIEVSSSNFPRFDRNPNTGATPATGAEMATALQTVLHNQAHRSYLRLPVVHHGG